MNLWIKYGPLAYTFFTRLCFGDGLNCWRNKILDVVYYLCQNVGFWTVPLFVLFFGWKTTFVWLVSSLLFYLYIFICFLVFYEIWYISNDIIAKKEKKWTFYLKDKVSDEFLKHQIIIRIFLGLFLLIPICFANLKLAICFVILLIIMWIVFLTHNIVRNYYYNFFSIFILRFLKFILFVFPFYFLIWNFYDKIVFDELVVFLLYQHLINIDCYDKNLWWQRILPYTLVQSWYLMISMIILFCFSNSLVYLIYLIIYFILYVIWTSKEKFEWKR